MQEQFDISSPSRSQIKSTVVNKLKVSSGFNLQNSNVINRVISRNSQAKQVFNND